MQLRNSESRFGLVNILLHWVMAVIILSLLCVGLYMVSLPIGLEKLKLYGLHKAFGLTVLGLAIFRLYWRLTNPSPNLALPWWEVLAARSMHWGLYAIMVIMPLSGWALSSASGLAPSFFGLFTLPNLVSPNEELRQALQSLHKFLAYSLIAAISLHTAAALKHHFIDKDGILRRMLWL